jgi:hypothetical protein
VADLFAILIWSTSDNGHELTETTEQWLLEAKDVRKVQIALHLDVYPFLDHSKMNEVLTKVASELPSVANRCNELIKSRERGSSGGSSGNSIHNS